MARDLDNPTAWPEYYRGPQGRSRHHADRTVQIEGNLETPDDGVYKVTLEMDLISGKQRVVSMERQMPHDDHFDASRYMGAGPTYMITRDAPIIDVNMTFTDKPLSSSNLFAGTSGIKRNYANAVAAQKKYDGFWQTGEGTVLALSEMDDSHLDNTIIFLQKNLAEIDRRIQELATHIAKSPQSAEANAGNLVTLTLRQVRFETIIHAMQEHQKTRGTDVSLKTQVRGSFVNVEATGTVVEGTVREGGDANNLGDIISPEHTS